MKWVQLSCILLFFLLGCKKNNNSTTGFSPGIFPNKIGDSWVYKVIDSAFTLQHFSGVTEYTMNIAVVDSVQLPGAASAMVWVYTAPGFADTNYVFQKGDTVCFASNTGPVINIVRQYIIPL